VAQVFSKDTFYGTVKVLDYSYGERRNRELIIDGLVQGGLDVSNGMSVYEYPYLMELLPYGMNPSGKSCLVLGLGSGIIPMWYSDRGIRTDVVDINPLIEDIAKRYFGFRTSGDVIVADGRYYLSRTGKKFDYIIVDVSNGDMTPTHILSIESFRLMRQCLTDRGILAINMVVNLKKDTLMTASVLAALRQAFVEAKIYPSIDPGIGKGIQNVAFIAYNDPSLTFSRERVKDFPVHPQLRSAVNEWLGREFSFPTGTLAVTLSDDYNPSDFFDMRLKEEVRRYLLRDTDWDMLI